MQVLALCSSITLYLVRTFTLASYWYCGVYRALLISQSGLFAQNASVKAFYDVINLGFNPVICEGIYEC